MKIIFVGGGTSGHINPALNIANYIRKIEPDSKILYVGSKNGIEKKMAKEEGFEFKGITTSGFSRSFSLNSFKKNIITIFNIFKSAKESKKILNEFLPDVCLGTGGYVCGSFLKQASKMGIPFFLQEQNSIPGLTTKILSKKAKKIFLGSCEAKKYLPGSNCVFTGNPIRSDFFYFARNKINSNLFNCLEIKEIARKILCLNNSETIILSFGGSLGAPAINNVILEVMKTKKYTHVHGYGRNNKSFIENFEKLNINKNKIKIAEYIKNMNIYMAASDLVICRAGAMTLSELTAVCKPAILVPSPNVAENHQFYNAVDYAKNNIASVIEESKISGKILIQEIEKNLKKNFLGDKLFKINNTCEKIYKIIKNDS
ncbi:MAG: UDP-N-acetylglucosamine--N-acetylmuramyl-(pentapeptide) pyrophosphoryl-undecaprenol N-acetylglucosamine transferase [Oscillospiraceae bacterium]|jgi:UDP-N-acetylglucosamine--N-acetylmuramyl-(pentapeptide) pyrophosphoryl-undecaprenol N-acetylglucosamine transferase|nr:UDP-N-acetylglucosamine--N-acetylmuramyl-(pentapeptide) pyrophosphoryl-undecaprenol N-acetylglucosamine transferase [Oscillospiraceae bacterium]